MMTDKDRQQLERIVSKQAIRAETVLFCMIFFLLLVGVANLCLAGWFAGMGGQSYGQFLSQWAAGIQFDKQYSGIFLKALERLVTGVSQFGLALVMAVTWWAKRRVREQTQRVIQTLKSSSAW